MPLNVQPKFISPDMTTDEELFSAIYALDKNAVGLGNVDNTSDINKPVSTAQQIAIDAKVENNLTASTTVAPSKTAVNTALAQSDADNKEYANNQSIINALIFG